MDTIPVKHGGSRGLQKEVGSAAGSSCFPEIGGKSNRFIFFDQIFFDYNKTKGTKREIKIVFLHGYYGLSF